MEKRYYLLSNTIREAEEVGDTYSVMEWFVVPTRGEPISDNCFYRGCKWCGEMWYFLYDAPTGVYICREPTLKDLNYRVDSEEFKDRLEKVRKSDFYNTMLTTFKKAMRKYEERVKGGKKNDK